MLHDYYCCSTCLRTEFWLIPEKFTINALKFDLFFFREKKNHPHPHSIAPLLDANTPPPPPHHEKSKQIEQIDTNVSIYA